MAERALDDGDYARAIGLWERALQAADSSQRPSLGLSLGRAYLRAQSPGDAIYHLARVVTATVSTEERAEAWGLLARSYEAQEEWRAAIHAYGQYLEYDDAAALYVRRHIAKAYEALGEEAEAAQQFATMDLSNIDLGLKAEILEAYAQVLRDLEDYDEALAVYERILSFTRYDSHRALISHRQGETLREAEREGEAIEVFQTVVETYPQTHGAYLALSSLDEMEAAEVTDLQRGQIMYYGRRYADAAEVLRRYLLSDSQEGVVTALYYLGLAYERLGDYSSALEAWNEIIEEHRQSERVADAWMARARVEGARGGDASEVYYAFWQKYGEHPRAPEALWRAAATLECAQEWDRARVFYQRIHELYPQYEHAPEALFREGLMAYAEGVPDTAMGLWSKALEGAVDAEKKARLLTWLGLAAQALGEEESARAYWERAEGTSPTSYYGCRARDLRQGVSSVLSLPASWKLPESDLEAKAWQKIGDWIAGWYAGDTRARARQAIETDPLMRRAMALWCLDWQNGSMTILRQLRDEVEDDPQKLLALARVADEMGAHAVTISCAEHILSLSRAEGVQEIPEALHELAYPTAYGDLVSAQAERYDVDPFLFLALVRQESRFNPRAVSYAGAEGLTQIMPDTGAWIASRLGPDTYERGFVSRPVISIRYGVWFLRTLLDLYDDDWVAALVAYNAGPGNLKRWTNDEPIADHDLFYETLPGSQAQRYVREVYSQYRRYEAIYRQ